MIIVLLFTKFILKQWTLKDRLLQCHILVGLFPGCLSNSIMNFSGYSHTSAYKINTNNKIKNIHFYISFSKKQFALNYFRCKHGTSVCSYWKRMKCFFKRLFLAFGWKIKFSLNTIRLSPSIILISSK